MSVVVRYSALSTIESTPGFKVRILDVKPGSFVSYKYDDDWYVGAVLDVSVDNGYVQINSLMPKGPSDGFRYPNRKDEPIQHIIRVVDLATTNHRQYVLEKTMQD